MEEKKEKKELKYMVWDVEEILAVCTKAELMKLNTIVDRVLLLRENEGRKPVTHFTVVSEDEPYYKTVTEFIELVKKQYGGNN